MSLSRAQLIEQFGQACDLGNAAVFVGAGLSKPAGLPDWQQLLNGPQAEAGVPSSSQIVADLPLLAEYILADGRYTRSRLESHILSMMLAAGADPTAQHESLARLPVDQIWTTNYDDLIERAATGRVIARDEDISMIGTAPRTIIKMHGSIDSSGGRGWLSKPIITRTDYEAYEAEHRRMWAMLHAVYLSRAFLFLGFSFSDPNIEILQRLSRIHGTATSNRHVTIMRRPADSEPDEQKYHDLKVKDLENTGVRVHEIDEYDELGPILTALERRTRSPRLFIAGSHTDDTKSAHQALCAALGTELARVEGWTFCSLGGPAGWHTSCSIADIRRAENTYDAAEIAFHFRKKEASGAPEMSERIGTAVYTDLDREPLVATLLDGSRALVAVGGSAGTREEIEWARQRGVGVVALAGAGGAAETYWQDQRSDPPELGGMPVNCEDWERLGHVNPVVAARAALDLLTQAMYYRPQTDHSGSAAIVRGRR